MRSMRSMLCFAFLVSLLSLPIQGLKYWGVNIAGAEFGPHFGGIYGVDYVYPPTTSVDFFAGVGMNTIRVPFLWERIQPVLLGPLNATEAGRLDDTVSYITKKGMTVVLDVHNYAMYNSTYVGTPTVPYLAFGNLWSQLASRYSTNSKVIFGLMNEPWGLPTENWLAAANSAIAAIRLTGATNIITVPGNAFTGAHSWLDSVGGFLPSAAVMGLVNDPMNNLLIEVHQYLDFDYSGTHPTCVNETAGSKALEGFTQWARAGGFKAFIGEFAGTYTDPVCMKAIPDMLNFVINNEDVYVGWTWWAAGPLWNNYFFDLEPGTVTNQNLIPVLQPYISLITPATVETYQQVQVPTYGTVVIPPYPTNNFVTNQQSGGGIVLTPTQIGVIFIGIFVLIIIAVAILITVIVVKRNRKLKEQEKVESSPATEREEDNRAYRPDDY